MLALTSDRLLFAWEQGAQRHPVDRDLMLFSMARPGTDLEILADAPLGARNHALMTLRQASFGKELACWIDCSDCGERMEFELDADQLPEPPETDWATQGARGLEVSGISFRYPSSRHLASIVAASDPDNALQQLLSTCIDSLDDLPQDPGECARLLTSVEDAVEAGDPWADLSMTLDCPACGCSQAVSLDVGAFLWEEIASRARRILDDVHVLAGHYGWSEADIIQLGDIRRAEYLARIGS